MGFWFFVGIVILINILSAASGALRGGRRSPAGRGTAPAAAASLTDMLREMLGEPPRGPGLGEGEGPVGPVGPVHPTDRTAGLPDDGDEVHGPAAMEIPAPPWGAAHMDPFGPGEYRDTDHYPATPGEDGDQGLRRDRSEPREPGSLWVRERSLRRQEPQVRAAGTRRRSRASSPLMSQLTRPAAGIIWQEVLGPPRSLQPWRPPGRRQ